MIIGMGHERVERQGLLCSAVIVLSSGDET